MQYGTKAGEVAWVDLTVPDAAQAARFYEAVVGWKPIPHDMGEYDDFEMKTGDATTVGVCHARGTNANQPPQWIVYVNVPSVAASAARCVEHGGQVVEGPRPMGQYQFCVVRDPAGAFLGLLSEAE